jgi:hypothetical protein
MSKGSKAPTGTQKVETTQTNLPPYAEPYYRSALERAMFESARPYEPYLGQRLAQFAPEETFAQQGIMSLGRPTQIGEATDIFRQVAGARGPSGMDIAGQFQPGAISPTYRGREFQTGYAPGQFQSGYTAGGIGDTYRAGQLGAGFEAGSLAAPGAIEQYMSPYQRMVTDVEKQAAIKASQMQAGQEGFAAARAGARGGTRSALIEAERQKGLGQQLAGIEARGAQSAFEQAQKAFEADRAARLQAGQFGVTSFQAQEAARQRAAELGLTGFQAQEAARQRQQELRFQSQEAGERARQEAARMGLSAQEASDAASRAAQDFMMKAEQANIESARQRALLGFQGMEADRAEMERRLRAGEALRGIGSMQQEMDLARLQAQLGIGGQRRGLMQQGLDIGYEDFLRQQAYPREQLTFLSNLLQGVPVQPGVTTATFGRVPTPTQQLLGAGLGAAGLYQQLGRGG